MNSDFGFRRSILGILKSISQGIESVDQKYRPNDNKQEPPPQPNIQVTVGIPPAITDYYVAENANGKKHNRRDSIRLGLEVVGLGAVLLGGWYAYRTFHEVQRQADYSQGQLTVMQKQLEATVRPWITIAEAKPLSPLISDGSGPGGISVVVHMLLRNVGHSAATKVFIIPELYAMPRTPPSVAEEIQRTCEMKAPSGDSGAFVVFPNVDTPWDVRILGITGYERSGDLKDGMVFVWPMICAVYGDRSQYHTGIVYGAWPTIFAKRKGVVPIEQIPFQRNPFFGEIAR